MTSALFALGHVATEFHPNRLGVFFPSLLFGWLRARTGGIGAAVVLSRALQPFCGLPREELRILMLSVSVIDPAIETALREDLGAGDVTTEAIVSSRARGIARAIAKQPLVVCGGDVFARVFNKLDAGLRVERRAAEGSRAEPGDVLWIVEGAAASILAGERTALNFAQRMSGIATLAARLRRRRSRRDAAHDRRYPQDHAGLARVRALRGADAAEPRTTGAISARWCS